ncbi:MAG: DUF4080 domain-containing protein, partial [Bacilli bacterium]|nr:DUF4080 domain-containing protein [Bacilli bacterium]
MKTLLVAINSKYIHPNMAVRYLKANCDFAVEIFEFTIKDNLDIILDKILAFNPDLIGFSVYIWNVEIIKMLLTSLRNKKKEMKILLGGPEVSYEYDDYFDKYEVDYIITKEGEVGFNSLLHAFNENNDLESVPNLIFRQENKIQYGKFESAPDVSLIQLPEIESGFDYLHKIAYVELSRGCPFRCSYCLASLEKPVRYFNLERIQLQLLDLYNKGSRTFKFLDRTFNIKEDIAKELIQYISTDSFKEAIFQFEVNADLLSISFIDFLNDTCPKDRIRFEIGIQSTNDTVNQAVDRRQDSTLLLNNIRRLKQGNLTLHLDLIAGLPYEDLNSFIKTFNDVFSVYGDELQLGFLKLLKGTKLYYQQTTHGYIASQNAPYELISNNYISKEELETIHIVEESLNIYWNKPFLKETIQKLTENHTSPFHFFLELGRLFLKKQKSFHRYQLMDLYQTLETYVKEESYIYNIREEYMK